MRRRMGQVGVAILVLPWLPLAPAAAAQKVPQLSGTYTVIVHQVCQGTFASNPVQFSDLGYVIDVVSTAVFNAKTGTVQISGTNNQGNLLVDSNAILTGDVMAQTALPSQSGSFTNTLTTLTLAGQLSQATYTNVAKGIVAKMTAIGIEDNRCSIVTTLERQQIN